MHVYSLVVLEHSCSENGSRYNDHLGNPKSEFGLLLARQGDHSGPKFSQLCPHLKRVIRNFIVMVQRGCDQFIDIPLIDWW